MNEISKAAKRARYASKAVVVVEPEPIVESEVVNETPKPVEKKPAIQKPAKTKRKIFKKV